MGTVINSLNLKLKQQKMHSFLGLTLFLLSLASSQASNLKSRDLGVQQRAWTTAACDGEDSNGKCCKMGQGDCDWDSDCCEGLKCGFGWGWDTDVCISGPNTRNFTWTDWSDWSVSCGAAGTRSRSRDCVPPVSGGLECPTQDESQTEACAAPACWTEFSEWSPCEGMCGSPGNQTRSRSCMAPDEGGEACPDEDTETESQECDTTGMRVTSD